MRGGDVGKVGQGRSAHCILYSCNHVKFWLSSWQPNACFKRFSERVKDKSPYP